MKFTLKNVGPIRDATVELGRLTVVCGKNNTGKTYLTNCLYEFYRSIGKKCSVQVAEEVPPDAVSAVIDLKDYRQSVVEAIRKRASVFSKSSATLHGGELQVEIGENEWPLDSPVQKTTWSLASGGGHCGFEVKKSGSKLMISRREQIDVDGEQGDENRKDLWKSPLSAIVNGYLFRQRFNGNFVGDAFSLTSERMGIAYFKDCIDIAMRASALGSVEVDDRQGVGEANGESNPSPLFPENVHEMLNMISICSQRRKTDRLQTSDFGADCQRALEELAGGRYDVKDNQILYAPLDLGDVNIDVKDASSSVRALFAIDLYVRYFAEKGDLLVIDEPETNLHPEKQRQLARFLARLVNLGVKVFITTHSDYILREFNALIALSGTSAHLDKIRETEGYAAEELLRASDVRAYVSRKDGGQCTFAPVTISERQGMEIKAIDAVVDDMNRIQDLIEWGI